jgi:hypothetical protein
MFRFRREIPRCWRGTGSLTRLECENRQNEPKTDEIEGVACGIRARFTATADVEGIREAEPASSDALGTALDGTKSTPGRTGAAEPPQLVPTVLRGNAVLDAPRPLPSDMAKVEDDAERRRRRSHAERGNEGLGSWIGSQAGLPRVAPWS